MTNGCKKVNDDSLLGLLNSVMSFDEGMRQQCRENYMKEYDETYTNADKIMMTFRSLADKIEQKSPVGSIIMGDRYWEKICWMMEDMMNIITGLVSKLKTKQQHANKLDDLTQENNAAMVKFICKQSSEGKIVAEPQDSES